MTHTPNLGLPAFATMQDAQAPEVQDAQAPEVQDFKGVHVKCLLGQSHGKIGR